jgi:hypothetical protein
MEQSAVKTTEPSYVNLTIVCQNQCPDQVHVYDTTHNKMRRTPEVESGV